MGRIPEVGSIWRHAEGNLYVVYDVGNTRPGKVNFPTRIHYIDTNGYTYDRTLDEWNEKYEEVTTLTPVERENILTCVRAIQGAKALLLAHFQMVERARPFRG